MTVSPEKSAERIVMQFPRNHVLDGGPDPHTWRSNSEKQASLGYAQNSARGSTSTVWMPTATY